METPAHGPAFLVGKSDSYPFQGLVPINRTASTDRRIRSIAHESEPGYPRRVYGGPTGGMEMPTININGANIHYDELGGDGPPIVLTPGARVGMDGVRSIAERLAGDHRVIIYDRRNCGASDVVIGGGGSEQDVWVDDLHELLHQIDAAPAWVGGGSNGCRVSLMHAIAYPEDIRGLLLWWVTGGEGAARRLGHQYYGQFIEAADDGGMETVVATPYIAERIQENPSNKERLLAMTPSDFISVMSRWRSYFRVDSRVLGVSEDEIRRIQAPTVIVSGDDETHLKIAADALHELLPGSMLHPPAISGDESTRMMQGVAPEMRDLLADRLVAIFGPFIESQRVPAG